MEAPLHPKASARAWIWRGLLFVLGLAFALWLLHAQGFDRVARVLSEAGPWLPLVILLECVLLATDVLALRNLLGPSASAIPLRVWVRSTALAYASGVLLPAGRATGEAARVTALAPTVGLRHAANACSRMQASFLLGNSIISFACMAAVGALGSRSTLLRLALLGNAVACAVFSVTLLLMASSERFAAWLGKHFRRFVSAPPSVEHHRYDLLAGVRATAWCLVGRCCQTVQYGVAVHAVGGLATIRSAFTAQGIHLVGAAIGDMIPNQMGATEGVYRAFAAALHLEAEPVRALGIALVARLAQVALALLCLLVMTLVPSQPRRASA